MRRGRHGRPTHRTVLGAALVAMMVLAACSPGGQPPPSDPTTTSSTTTSSTTTSTTPPGPPDSPTDPSPPPGGPPLPPPCAPADFFGGGWGDLVATLDVLRKVLPPVGQPLYDSLPSDCPGPSGDPHITTFDGLSYDFQEAGEFVAVDGPDIELQVRLEPWSDSTTVSIVTGVAARLGGHVVQVDQDHPASVLIDGEEVADGAVAFDEGGFVLQSGEDVLLMWPDGAHAVSIDDRDAGSMDVQITPGASLAGASAGFLGNADGDPMNDPSVGGEHIDPDDFDRLYGLASDAWAVTANTSLFTYRPGEGPETYRLPDFPSGEPDLDGEQERQAREACIENGVYRAAALDDCILDVAVTGDERFIESARQRQPAPRVGMGESCLDALEETPAQGRTGITKSSSAPGPAPAGAVDWQPLDPDEEVMGGFAAGDDEILVVATADAVAAFDASTGERRWYRESGARDVPVVAGGVVVTTSRVGHEIRLLEDGDLCGIVEFGAASEPTTPIVVDGWLVASGEYHIPAVRAVDLAGGDHWDRPLVGGNHAVAAAEGLVVASARNAVVALELTSGDVVWEQDASGADVPPTIVGALVVTAGNALVGLDLASGDVRWEAEVASGPRDRLASNDAVVVAAGARDGVVVALDATTGDERWRRDVGESPSAPVIVGDMVYLALAEALVGLSLTDGSEVVRTDGLVVKDMDAIPGALIGGNVTREVIVVR